MFKTRYSDLGQRAVDGNRRIRLRWRNTLVALNKNHIQHEGEGQRDIIKTNTQKASLTFLARAPRSVKELFH